MSKVNMTVLDMMNVVSSKVTALEEATPGKEREEALADADAISKLAKNFFIGANLLLEQHRIKAKNKTVDTKTLDAVMGSVD